MQRRRRRRAGCRSASCHFREPKKEVKNGENLNQAAVLRSRVLAARAMKEVMRWFASKWKGARRLKREVGNDSENARTRCVVRSQRTAPAPAGEAVFAGVARGGAVESHVRCAFHAPGPVCHISGVGLREARRRRVAQVPRAITAATRRCAVQAGR